jgi:hypothetical protein
VPGFSPNRRPGTGGKGEGLVQSATDQMEIAAAVRRQFRVVLALPFDADVAQLVEQLIRNQQVVSSSLTVGSSFRNSSTRQRLQAFADLVLEDSASIACG